MDQYGTGIKGEMQAQQFLIEKGYKIIDTNISYPNIGELDIVAKDGGVLVFIEVRTRADNRYGHPFETITPQKIKKIVRASKHYLMDHKIPATGYRYDVVGIIHDTPELIQNAFFAYWH